MIVSMGKNTSNFVSNIMIVQQSIYSQTIIGQISLFILAKVHASIKKILFIWYKTFLINFGIYRIHYRFKKTNHLMYCCCCFCNLSLSCCYFFPTSFGLLFFYIGFWYRKELISSFMPPLFHQCPCVRCIFLFHLGFPHMQITKWKVHYDTIRFSVLTKMFVYLCIIIHYSCVG